MTQHIGAVVSSLPEHCRAHVLRDDSIVSAGQGGGLHLGEFGGDLLSIFLEQVLLQSLVLSLVQVGFRYDNLHQGRILHETGCLTASGCKR